MTTVKATEHDEQKALFEYAEWKANQDLAWRMLHVIPNGQYRDGQRPEAGLSFSKGYPDIGLDVPRKKPGGGIFCGLRIELKVGDGSLSPEQSRWILDLRRYGYYAVVCYGFTEAKDVLEDYLALEEPEYVV